MTLELSGQCGCGGVRYRLTARPMFVNCCHCLLCQRQTGGAFVINAVIETSAIELLAGAPLAVPMPTESGLPHDVYRCPGCMVALWSDYRRRPGLRFLRVATLDAPHQLAPDAHIFTRSKVPWLELPAGVPSFAEHYPLEETWPAEALQRRQAVTQR